MTVATAQDARAFIRTLLQQNPSLTKLRSGRSWTHLSFLFLTFLGLLYGTFHFSGWLGLPLFIFAGIMQYHFTVMVHEASHGGLFTNQWCNKNVGDLIAGFVTFSVSEYQIPHIQHHRILGQPDDPDFYSYEMKAGYTTLGAFLFQVLIYDTGISSLIRRSKRVFLKSSHPSAKTQTDLRKIAMVLIAQMMIFAICISLATWWAYFVFWFIPMLLFVGLFNKLRVFGEHGGLVGHGPKERVLSRTTFSNAGGIKEIFHRIERFVLSPLNFNYHHEHHLMPAIPYTSLPFIHQALLNAGYFEFNQDLKSDSYFSTYMSLFNRRSNVRYPQASESV